MKIRTITVFLTLTESDDIAEAVKEGSKLLDTLKRSILDATGYKYEVQTLRIATNSFEDWVAAGTNAAVQGGPRPPRFDAFEEACRSANIAHASIGPARSPESLDAVTRWASRPESLVSFSALIPEPAAPNGAHTAMCAAAARTAKALSAVDSGSGSFRFCAAGPGCAAGIPFFPVAFAEGPTSRQGSVAFGIGAECSDLLVEASRRATAPAAGADGGTPAPGPTALRDALAAVLTEHLKPVDAAARAFAEGREGGEGGNSDTAGPCPTYLGIDTSIAPGVAIEGSIAAGFGAMLRAQGAAVEGGGSGEPGPLALARLFGSPGTLALSEAVTSACKAVDVRRTGYCGLMLAILEDAGLAEASRKRPLTISDLLLWSSVCGCGLDCVPVAGDVSESALARVFSDTAAMSHRLNKPLTARLFPAPGKSAGEDTDFGDNPYLCDARVFSCE